MSNKKSGKQIRRVATVTRSMRARYDAAQITSENRRHWSNADAYDAVRANTSEIRLRLRKNARYEVANNSYAKGIVLTLANYLIGTGPRLQMLDDDKVLCRQVESEFIRWANEIDLSGKLRAMRMARAQDGEAFAMLVSNPKRENISLDLRLIEADQIDTPAMASTDYIEGIKFDEYGNPASYCVYKYHPGGLNGGFADFDNVSAQYIIHWFRTDRPGQIRGIPEITPALPLFAQLRRYTLAVLNTAEILAEFTMFLKSSGTPEAGPANVSEKLGGDFAELEVGRGLMTTLPEGWEAYQVKSEQPSTTYPQFKQEILNEIARCLNIPYNIAACNSSSYNYASGRLDHQTFFKSNAVDRSNCELIVIDKVFNAWLVEAVKFFGWNLKNTKHLWYWDGLEHVDPVKEATAQATRLESNTTTLAIECAKQGLDWEDVIRQRAKEIALCKSLDITTATPSKQTKENKDVAVQEEKTTDEE